LTTVCPSDAPAAAVDAADFVRFEETARLARLNASYWTSISLAAERGERLTLTVHVKQAVLVTRSVLAVIKELGAQERT
jgi:hypothetical protein